jgi:hypothetical protein
MLEFFGVTLGAVGGVVTVVGTHPSLQTTYPRLAAHCAWLGAVLVAAGAILELAVHFDRS